MFNSCVPFLQYMNTLTYLSNEAFSSIPPELVPDLQRMLSANESFRSTAMDFTGTTWALWALRCYNLSKLFLINVGVNEL